MSQDKKATRLILKCALTALILSAGSWLFLKQMESADRELFKLVMMAFGTKETALGAAVASQAADFLLALAWCSAGIATGYNLSSVPRILAGIQLFVLSLVCEILLWSGFHLETGPLMFWLAIVLGSCAGYKLRHDDERERKGEAQRYELMLRNKELSETRLQIVKQDEVDRRMLAADLHDQVLNDLKAIKVKFETYEKEPSSELAKSIDGLLKRASDQVREVMDSLSPSALEHLGLVAALEDCLRRGAERGGFKVRFKSKVEDGDAQALSSVEQSLLYRLMQETVNNVAKHAEASLVRATLDRENDQLVIRVVDDGRGIEAAKLKDDSRGIRYMRQRADLIGATIAWREGDEGKGTAVEIRVDLAGQNGSPKVGN